MERRDRAAAGGEAVQQGEDVLKRSSDMMSGVPQLGGFESEAAKMTRTEIFTLRGQLFDCMGDEQRAVERER
eukprot:1187265-Prorocentrum_minimum.AAC.4